MKILVMKGKKKIRAYYPSSEKVYIKGDINKIMVGMRKIKLSDTVTIDEDGMEIRKKNNPVVIYDTSGPYSDPKITTEIEAGIPRIREVWSAHRKDILQQNSRSNHSTPISFPLPQLPYRAKEGKNITQMFYAKRRIITPEMEYVAIRENQQIEDLDLKSYITPEFVRKEVAAGRAIIPANINHPEAEPMIIGKKFLVKITSLIDYSQASSTIETKVENVIENCLWGSDTLMDIYTGSHIHEHREWIIRNSPVPIGAVPIYQALEKVNGQAEELNWNIYRDTLIEQAEQGVDYVTIHAAMLRKQADMLLPRLSGIVSMGGLIIAQWMSHHKKENFLFTHFAEICEILKAYDVAISIGDGLCSGSIYDANDSAQYSELRTLSKLIDTAWDQYVQVMTEGSGHTPMNKIPEYIKEQQYAAHGAPFYSFGPITTDITPANDHITSAIGAALSAWHGSSMIGCITPGRNHILANKIAAHAADLAKGHPGAQVRDNAISKAHFESRFKDQNNLSL
ncbi:phosphomethylpyrimidine synthase [Bacteroidia bacterium]|nr:phosphomethylpyrimidine synthase [Bacteroidia bacterium]